MASAAPAFQSGLTEVVAVVHPENTASQRVATRMGMTHQGTNRPPPQHHHVRALHRDQHAAVGRWSGCDGDGGLGDRLLAAVLRGEKTATSSLAVACLSGEPLPWVGERLTLVDHGGRPNGVVVTTRVTIVPLHLVGNDVAWDEGEGFVNAAHWRQAHVAFWEEVADLVRADAGDPSSQFREAEPVVVHWFRLLEPAGAPTGRRARQ